MGGYVYWWDPKTREIVAMAELGDLVPANTDGLPFVVSIDPATPPDPPARLCTGDPGCPADDHMLCCPTPPSTTPEERP